MVACNEVYQDRTLLLNVPSFEFSFIRSIGHVDGFRKQPLGWELAGSTADADITEHCMRMAEAMEARRRGMITSGGCKMEISGSERGGENVTFL